MTECFFSQPENVDGRRKLKDITYTDVFPQQNPYLSEIDSMFPEKVQDHIQQLRSQDHVRRMAELVNQHLQQTSLHGYGGLTDDQRRVQKIKERMLKRKMQQQQQQQQQQK